MAGAETVRAEVTGVGLDVHIGTLPGVGETRARQFESVGVHTAFDLLHYFPRDYQYESGMAPIGKLKANTVATARGEVVAVDYVAYPKPRFEATLEDDTGKLALTFFNGAYLRTRIKPGMTLRVKGKLRSFRGMSQMHNPKWSELKEHADPDDPMQEPDKFVPIYPASGRLTSDVIATLVADNLPAMTAAVDEIVPEGLLRRHELMSRAEAYRAIHRPGSKGEAIAARRRLVYDELFVMQMGLALSRQRGEKQGARGGAPILRCDRLVDERIRRRFPFEMTRAQLAATYEVLRDLGGDTGKPMNRLVQGDVGSGKTAVAVYAMLVAVANRMQAALLAPTEVLAEQHYLTLSRFLKDSSVSVELFTSRTKKLSKGGLVRALEAGKIHIAVGTQALLQGDITFANLGLVVVDEQHRLGVKQRATLRGKGSDDHTDGRAGVGAADPRSTHYLVMTATPIPRTLALSYFADFDLSVIDELPPGRQEIKTTWVKAREQARAWDFIRTEVQKGRQAFIVVPQIGDDGADASLSGGDDAASLLKEFKRLSEGPLNGLRLAMLHGRMDAAEKQSVMERFRSGAGDVLVATTVIEVGVDIPNASVIAIMDAEKFGLSQLHQLRGRVGRGGHQSYCLLISDADSEQATARLQALTQTNSGFEIAELDLRMRGPGEFFGTRQHGLPEFRLADLTQEADLLHEAREDAKWLLERDPKLNAPELKALRAEIARDFADALPLATVG